MCVVNNRTKENRMKKFEVTVHAFRKQAVLNPEEGPVLKGLHNLGFDTISRICIGKCFVLRIEADNETNAQGKACDMCKRLLVNLVVEEFQITSVTEAA